jgi:hypothetical protein
MVQIKTVSDFELATQLRRAKARSRVLQRTEPRARSARYESSSNALHIDLTNNGAVDIPVDLIPELATATSLELAHVEVDPLGKGLLWRDLNVGLDFVAVLERVLGGFVGSNAAQHLGRRTSRAKAAAARANGLKGGRPRKSRLLGHRKSKSPSKTAKRA